MSLSQLMTSNERSGKDRIHKRPNWNLSSCWHGIMIPGSIQLRQPLLLTLYGSPWTHRTAPLMEGNFHPKNSWDSNPLRIATLSKAMTILIHILPFLPNGLRELSSALPDGFNWHGYFPSDRFRSTRDLIFPTYILCEQLSTHLG